MRRSRKRRRRRKQGNQERVYECIERDRSKQYSDRLPCKQRNMILSRNNERRGSRECVCFAHWHQDLRRWVPEEGAFVRCGWAKDTERRPEIETDRQRDRER